jgi:PAS domain S-box-containing protein
MPHTTLSRRRLPELTELEALVTAASEGSIRRAAERLHLSPAGVAKRLDNLEAVVGRQLLARGPRGLRLTAEGRRLNEHAARLLDEARGLLDQREPEDELLHALLAPRPAEAALRDTRSLLATVLDSIEDGIAITDFRQRVILAANTALCRITGYDREELVGESADRLAFWRGPDELAAARAELAERTVVHRRVRVRRRSGEFLTGTFEARLLDLSGNAVAVIRVAHES